MDENLCLENSVVVRLATSENYGQIYKLVDEYAEKTSLPFDRDKTKESLDQMVKAQGVLLFELYGKIIGGMAGYVIPCAFNNNVFFSVMMFYVCPDHRSLTKKIINEVELVLLASPVTHIIVGVLSDENHDILMRYFRMHGYSRIETHMAKTLGGI